MDPARPTIGGYTRTGALMMSLIILIAAALATIIAAAAAANAEPGGLSGPMPLDV